VDAGAAGSVSGVVKGGPGYADAGCPVTVEAPSPSGASRWCGGRAPPEPEVPGNVREMSRDRSYD